MKHNHSHHQLNHRTVAVSASRVLTFGILVLSGCVADKADSTGSGAIELALIDPTYGSDSCASSTDLVVVPEQDGQLLARAWYRGDAEIWTAGWYIGEVFYGDAEMVRDAATGNLYADYTYNSSPMYAGLMSELSIRIQTMDSSDMLTASKDIYNDEAPEVAQQSPEYGSRYIVNEDEIVFSAQVSDVECQDDLALDWYLNGEIWKSIVPDAEGVVSFTVSDLTVDDYTLELVATDSIGQFTSLFDSVIFVVEYPPESCNGIDDDHDGEMLYETDSNGDGYLDCNDADGDGYSLATGDCDETNTLINAYILEVCDGIDNDCDGLIDDADDIVHSAPEWYQDLDGDGYGDENIYTTACLLPEGYLVDNSDCDDTSNLINPSAPEICDSQDNDCDDELPVEEADDDEDGYMVCEEDCDDTDASIYLGSIESTDRTDGIDNDCDGIIDNE